MSQAINPNNMLTRSKEVASVEKDEITQHDNR